MDSWFFRFLLTLAFAEQASSLPLVCVYNGTSFAEGEVIKTEEPCLLCSCRRGSLSCNLRVCGDVPELPLPGCFVVHKASECCPELLCEDKYNNNGLELRTFRNGNSMGENGCIKNGILYSEGSAVGSSRLCEYCYCIRKEIKCVKPRCILPLEGCRPIYLGTSCCPTHYDCRMRLDDSASNISENQGCAREGIFYQEGEMIPAADSSKCESCYCMNGKIECVPIACRVDNTFNDCQPLKTNEDCCPTGFSCASAPENGENESVPINATGPMSRTYTKPKEVNPVLLANETEYAANETAKAAEKNFQNSSSVGMKTILPVTPPPDTFWIAKKEKIATEFDYESQMEMNSEFFLGNWSQAADEYDSYDYNEPKLPPSLPNLVIFPFVAADAVVNDKIGEYKMSNSKKIESKGTFTKNHFSSPVKTEGGFIPKDPNTGSDPFYEYVRQKQKLPVLNNADENILSGLESASFSYDFSQPSSTTTISSLPLTGTFFLQRNHTESLFKPVTVTYKNVAVSYYPDYLVTTKKDSYKTDKNSVVEKSSQPSSTTITMSNGDGITVVTPAASTFTDFSEPVSPMEIQTRKTFDSTSRAEYFEGPVGDNADSPSTVKPSSHSLLVEETSKVSSQIHPAKGNKESGASKTTPDAESQSPKESQKNSWENQRKSSETSTRVGALLKLAGCNIYGRMYKIGKVILELSSPCTECVCTDFGVQCASISC